MTQHANVACNCWILLCVCGPVSPSRTFCWTALNWDVQVWHNLIYLWAFFWHFPFLPKLTYPLRFGSMLVLPGNVCWPHYLITVILADHLLSLKYFKTHCLMLSHLCVRLPSQQGCRTLKSFKTTVLGRWMCMSGPTPPPMLECFAKASIKLSFNIDKNV